MAIDRNTRLLYLDPLVGAQEVTLGALIDEVKREVILDLQSDTELSKAIASAAAAHLTASVRPT